jgi:rhodanese-related sulfurtransferase
MTSRGLIMLLAALWVVPVVAGNPDYRSPEQVAGAETVDVDAAQDLHSVGVVFVDVRAPRLHQRQHIPGSVHLDLNSRFTEEELARVVGKDQPFVVYCSGVTCTRSFRAAVRAVGWGYTRVKYFRGGVVAWRDAGLALQKPGS